MKVLLADDDRTLTHLLSTRLRSSGWAVTIALDAMQTVMFAVRSVPDVIVLDISMPGGNGITALRKLRASARTSQVPVIVMSGTMDPRDEPVVRELGVQAVLRKPVDVEELETILRGIVGAPKATT